MKPLIHTIFIWILSLSLTGLPVVALSQNLSSDMANLNQSEQSMIMHTSAGSASSMHCQSKMPQKNVIQTGISSTPMSQHAMHMSSSTEQVSMDDCRCGVDCQCQPDMSCQSVGHFGASAILQSILFVSSPLHSQLTAELNIAYYDCDTDSEVIPPIA